MSLFDYFDPQKSVEIMGRYNRFLSLKVNILSIQSVLLSWHAILLEYNDFHGPFLWNTLLMLLEK